MSQSRFIKLKVWIKNTIENGSIVNEIMSAVSGLSEYAEDEEYPCSENSGYFSLTAAFSGEINRNSMDDLTAALLHLNELEDGSFAIMLCDSDYGVNGEYYCWGTARKKEAKLDIENNNTWSTEDQLVMEAAMSIEQWCEMLEAEEDEVTEAVEDIDEEGIISVIGNELTAVFTDEEDELLLSVNDAEEADDKINLRLDADIHEFDNMQFERLKEALSNVENAEIIIHYDSAKKTGDHYINEMIDPENYEVLIFESSENYIGNEKVIEFGTN